MRICFILLLITSPAFAQDMIEPAKPVLHKLEPLPYGTSFTIEAYGHPFAQVDYTFCPAKDQMGLAYVKATIKNLAPYRTNALYFVPILKFQRADKQGQAIDSVTYAPEVWFKNLSGRDVNTPPGYLIQSGETVTKVFRYDPMISAGACNYKVKCPPNVFGLTWHRIVNDPNAPPSDVHSYGYAWMQLVLSHPLRAHRITSLEPRSRRHSCEVGPPRAAK